MDSPTIERISRLHPSVRNEVAKIINECDASLTGRAKVRITQGLRTFEEQQKLYNQRPKVTNAKAGQSVHNYGFALDICLIIDGKVASWDTAKDWDNDKIADWYEVVKSLPNMAGNGAEPGRILKICHTLKRKASMIGENSKRINEIASDM